jgi:hypothetical protein
MQRGTSAYYAHVMVDRTELDYVAVLPKYKQVGDPLKLLGEIGEISNEPHGLSGFDHVA